MTKLKAGTYYIGDPCYAFQGDDWNKILDENDYFNAEECSFKNIPLFAVSTKHGDGCYEDQYGNEYPVDAGLIGCVPIELCNFGEGIAVIEGRFFDNRGIENFKFVPGKIHTFDSEFVCSEENGMIEIGDFFIDTDPNEQWGDDQDYFFNEEYSEDDE